MSYLNSLLAAYGGARVFYSPVGDLVIDKVMQGDAASD